MIPKPVHYHTLVLAQCTRDPDETALAEELEAFLHMLIRSLEMHVLIKPIVQLGRYGYTGLAGIVTSHIAFHYFESTRTLQLDVYSCHEYEPADLLKHLDSFWGITTAEVIFLRRDDSFQGTAYAFSGGTLCDERPITLSASKARRPETEES